MSKRRRKRKNRKISYLLIPIAVICLLCVLATYRLFPKNEVKPSKEVPHKTKALHLKDKEPKAILPDRSSFAVNPGIPAGSLTPTDEKVVYLTLDDGPSQNTQSVLDILDRYKVKATFFVTGAMPEHRHMIKEAYDKGHTIALHTYSHDYPSVYSSVDAYFADLDAIGNLVKEEIGYVPCFIRFPGGSSNTISASYTHGIMSALVQEVQARGYQYYDWNVSSGDGAVRSADQLVAQATTGVENNIVLLSHDSAAKQTTVEALPRIIEYYQNLGYVFKALDRESYAPHHGVNN